MTCWASLRRFAAWLVAGLLLFVPASAARSAGASELAPDLQSFSFTAVGDYGHSRTTAATLRAIAATKPTFHLALGDLSYDSSAPERDWCRFVRENVGPDLPFELLTGNHEDFDLDPANGLGGNIDNFASCLPNKMDGLQGTYGRDYSFDYPPVSPVARFIMLSPEVTFESGTYQDYSPGADGYNWVSSAIDDGRLSGINWFVAAMHVNCITMGVNSCSEQSQYVMDLLLAKRVDLIVQGHDHDYQRSKQIAAPTATCARIQPKAFEPGCTLDDGESGTYARGQGSVLVIVGTGGAGLSMVNPDDPDAAYFARWMGRGVGSVFGFLHVDLSSARLSASFVPTSPGNFSDAFAIE